MINKKGNIENAESLKRDTWIISLIEINCMQLL